MAFIDEIKIHAQAGYGGDGVVRWRQEKFIDKGGPSGGNGGHGGNVYAFATRDMHQLAFYRQKKSFKAARGEDGMGQKKHGKSGDDVVLSFPIGSIITNLSTNKKYTLKKEGEKVLLLSGGGGGFGNEHYKSSTNTTPTKASPGKEGETADFFIELELFADVGLVGLPNAGKSSLLNSLTRAQAKVGDYAFTTLDPNLGDFHGFIIADIPGLIEGASEGKGLGTKFLRHIKHTETLVHLVSFENKDMIGTYHEIRAELKKYGHDLDTKDEIILLSKTDMAKDKKEIAVKLKEFKKLKKPVYTISLFDDASLKEFGDELVKYLRKEKKKK